MCLVRMTALFLIIYGQAWSVTFNVHLTRVADLWAHTDIFQRKCIFQRQIRTTVTNPNRQVYSRILAVNAKTAFYSMSPTCGRST